FVFDGHAAAPVLIRDAADHKTKAAGGHVPAGYCSGRFRRLQRSLDRLDHLGVGRLHAAGEHLGEAAVRCDQVFVEIPFRQGILAQLGGDPAVEGMRVLPEHLLLLGEREVDVEIDLAEFPDLLGRTGLLAAEIVRRHAKHHQALVPVVAPQLLQVGILRGEAALRGGVDQQHGLAAELLHRQRLAVDGGEVEIMGAHAGPFPRRGGESGKGRQRGQARQHHAPRPELPHPSPSVNADPLNYSVAMNPGHSLMRGRNRAGAPMISLPGLLTFAALSLVALVLGVSLTRLVPGLAGQHPGVIALVLLLAFWSIRERWLRHAVQKRLIGEIEGLSEELALVRGTPVQPDAEPAAEPQLAASRPAIQPMPEPADDGTLLEAVRDALNNNRVELHVQPVVSLPQWRIRYFELLARPRDASGRAYQAAECLEALDAAGLRAEFDALMLLRSVQLVRRLESRARDAGFFLNLSAAMLEKPETF